MANFLAQDEHIPNSIAHFFNAAVDDHSIKPVSLPASFLAQLLQLPSTISEEVLHNVISNILLLASTTSSWESCSFSRLWTIVERTLPLLPELTTIVDGLDECRTNDNCVQILLHLHAIATLLKV